MKNKITLIILSALMLGAQPAHAGWLSSAAEWMWNNSGKTVALAAAAVGCVWLAVKYRAAKVRAQAKPETKKSVKNADAKPSLSEAEIKKQRANQRILIIQQKLHASRQQKAREIKAEVEKLYSDFSQAATKKGKNHRPTIFSKGQEIARKCKPAFVGDNINKNKAEAILNAQEWSMNNKQAREEFCEQVTQIVEHLKLLAM